MQIEKTALEGLVIIQPTVYKDSRGHFYEAYNSSFFKENGLEYNFIQDNQSFSKKGVVRGLHLQTAPYAQTKLVRVLQGEILDVVVDVRKNSPTFGQKFSIHLSAENQKQLLVPAGFLHGFSVLSDVATVMYKVDNSYDRDSERGVCYNDPTLAIDWLVEEKIVIVSDKDVILPAFDEIDWDFDM